MFKLVKRIKAWTAVNLNPLQDNVSAIVTVIFATTVTFVLCLGIIGLDAPMKIRLPFVPSIINTVLFFQKISDLRVWFLYT